ncbi:hypothetical protein B0T21DRAFT_375114 [Apiosordaria backusii]|uniref:Uncharacterized protein n=1 Tax=Apiosordaria backusii TaxID=314023 RepID=A0AA40AIR1_9PEZI|nr:hypothetical protein B0T21DRAFT_375114 [Apiosordaria backusii]
MVLGLFKSYLTRYVGVGCGWKERAKKAHRVIIGEFGGEHEYLTNLLGERLWFDVYNVNMETMYEERYAGEGPKPECSFKETRQVVPREFRNTHLERKIPRGKRDRYAIAGLDYSWEVIAPICWGN